MVVVIRVAEGDTAEETLKNVIGDAKVGSGIHAFLDTESIIHVTPKILIAPEFTHLRPNSQMNPVTSTLIPIAERLRAVIIADGPNTDDSEAITWRKDCSSNRVYMVDPWLKVFPEQTLPASPYVAGLIAKSDNEYGFWCSPSNREINGIVGTARPIDFALGDANCRANYLNENDVATIIHHNGYRLWGNRTCAVDNKWAFLSVRRTADLIYDSILRAHLWAIDRNITRTYIDEVVASVNAYLQHLRAIGAVLGGQCYSDDERNAPSRIEQGEVYFSFDFTPPYPAEHITFRAHIINDYIKEII